LAAVAAGKHVILCKCIYVIITLSLSELEFHRFQGGHTNTERGYLPVLAKKLQLELQSNEFKDQGLGDVEVLVSQKDHHPLEFV
jgi:putative NIF3 family GTP cyclohydrolase 1 type 2